MSRSVNKRPIAVIDCETDPFEHGAEIKPFVWGYYDGLEYVYFWGEDCTEKLVEFLSDKKLLIYAHNGGKFDYFFILKYLEKDNIKIINGRLSQAKLGENVLRDSYNIIPVPLGAYKKDDIDYNKMKREVRDQHKAEIIDYLEGDCVYLYELVTAFCDRFGRKLTVAGAAMTELIKTIPNGVERFNLFTDAKYRPFYYGGRCQAFKTGEIDGEIKIYDINSAYPYAMTFDHPDPSFNSWAITTGGALPSKPQYFAKIKAVSCGCLPVRDEKTKELSFPSDNEARIFYATGWEIQAGLETNTLEILEVIEVREPDHLINFKEYVDKHYEEKSNAVKGSVEEIFAKLLLNSPYGKWAQSSLDYEDWQLVAAGDWPKYTDKEIERIKAEGLSVTDGIDNSIIIDERGRLQDKIYLWEFETELDDGTELYKRPSPDANGFYNVAVAASITGFVRAYLWRAICASDEVFYCDTDSIVCREFRGPVGPELGAWKFEGTATKGFIAGKKLYALWCGSNDPDFSPQNSRESKKAGWKMAAKGARLTPYEIAYIVKHERKVKWLNEAPTFSLTRGVKYLAREIKMKKVV